MSSNTPETETFEGLRQQFNRSGIVLEWQRLKGVTNSERDLYVDVLLANVKQVQTAALEAAKREAREDEVKRLIKHFEMAYDDSYVLEILHDWLGL